MTRPRGFALLGALTGLVALVCAGVITGYGHLGYGSGGRGGTQARTPVGVAAPAVAAHWTGTWAAAPAGAEPGAPNGYPGRTIRNVVRGSVGGTGVRITFSNLYGTRPLLIGHASVALRAAGGTAARSASAAAGTMRRLTFARRAAVSVPPGGQILSDPVALRLPPATDLLVTLFTPVPGGPVTYHPRALQTSYLADGDRTEDLDGRAYDRRTPSWRYLTAVDVLAPDARGAVVAFGDSITDGVGSRADTNHRWPDFLAARLRDRDQDGRRTRTAVAPRPYGVLNEGIGGNRVLGDGVARGKGASGLDRFRRDVLDRAGARIVVVDLGINDILGGGERNPARITAGLRNLTRQAHARGLRVIGSTLTPFGGYSGHSAAGEAVRERVNAEIRAGHVFDDVVDFDRALRDPYAPGRLLPAYDSGDHLHPSDEGYRVMARSLDLKTLDGRSRAQL